jgi:YggT family protein
MNLTLPMLTVRSEIAEYLDTVIYIYIIVIFAYIVSTWVFAMGLRIPYYRYTDAVLSFLRDVTEPYLRIFRRILPRFGPMDFSPIVAIIALDVVRALVVPLISG